MLKTSGGDEKAPEKDKKKERSGSIKKRLSIGYGFSSIRKRNPIKGVFEEEEKKKGKSIEIKVDDLGWKQTKHVGQEEAQQLKALMALTRQLGEEDTDDIVKLLAEWDKEKVQKEIDDKKRIQMQKNRSLQVVMEQWNIDPQSLSTSGRSTPTVAAAAKENEERNNRENTNETDKKRTPNEATKANEEEKNEDDRTRKGRERNGKGKGEEEKEQQEEEDECSSTNEDSMEDEFTGGSTIIDDDDEELMEVAEIGSDEGSEGGRSPRSSFNERTTTKRDKKIREPRPPSMIFGKKENLDLRDWQTFLEAERARALPYSSVASPRRTASPRNSPRNSPAGFLIFKQKKMLSLTNSAAQPPSSPTHPSSKLPSSAGGTTGECSPTEMNTHNNNTNKKGGSGRRSWSDDDGLEGDQMVASHHRETSGEAVIELAEMSDGEEESYWRRATPRLVPPLPLPVDDEASGGASGTPQPMPGSTPTKSSGASTPTIPRIVLSPQPHDRGVKLQPSQSSPRQQRGGALTSPERNRKEQMRRISLSDSQLMFFQRWMRDTVKDGKVEVPADVEQEIKDHERESAKRYERMDADALRKALVKRDKDVAVLKRAVEDLKRREEKAASREKELREEVRREKERADRVQQRETVLKDLIREKVEEKRKMTQERDKERQKEEEKEKRKEKKEKKKSEKHDKKRKGSAIKFVSKEKEKEREREKEVRERSRSARERERDVEMMSGGGISRLERGVSEELATLQEVGKGGTWSKSRGREVKIFKHLRSKSSEEVPTAYVAKDVRESAPASIAAVSRS